jgi:hydrogenase expression/formation protein HypD
MKYLNEFRDPVAIKNISEQIKDVCTRPWKIMEVCGGQTHSIVKYQLEQILPQNIEMVHGPGCPVCVTPQGVIDFAVHLCLNEKVLLASFGDMMRVPGANGSLMQARAQGGKVEMVYSPLDAVKLAQKNPEQDVVFLAVGFETTSLPNALALLQAQKLGLNNFYLLTHQVRVPPAIGAIMDNPESRVQGFLAAGHVCTVTGAQEYLPLSQKYQVPIVVTGFEPVDILLGIKMLVQMLEAGTVGVQVQYTRSVRPEGNPAALKMLNQVFQFIPQEWRGIGVIPESGFGLREEFSSFDARKRWVVPDFSASSTVSECQAAKVLQGLMKPKECPYFGTKCHPQNPMGAPMVSSEGACAAYFEYE